MLAEVLKVHFTFFRPILKIESFFRFSSNLGKNLSRIRLGAIFCGFFHFLSGWHTRYAAEPHQSSAADPQHQVDVLPSVASGA